MLQSFPVSADLLLLNSFKSITPSPRLGVTFRNMLLILRRGIFTRTACYLSETVHSIQLLLPPTSGEGVLHPLPEDRPCLGANGHAERGDKTTKDSDYSFPSRIFNKGD
jgi:hypothetical protein